MEYAEEFLKRISKAKKVEIKLLTYDRRYYTYAKIDENCAEIVDYKEIEGCETNYINKLYNVVNDTLVQLKFDLENKMFIHCFFEQKILNCKEIKEVIVNYI